LWNSNRRFERSVYKIKPVHHIGQRVDYNARLGHRCIDLSFMIQECRTPLPETFG
jgi:hypothetical protein